MGTVQIGHQNPSPTAAAAATSMQCDINTYCFYSINLNGGNSAIGIAGLHTSTSGDAAGVHGETSSRSVGATGVLGLSTASAPGLNAAGVRGINQATNGFGAGVWGTHTDGGFGVRGESDQGTGVLGRSTSTLSSASGPAVWGETLCGHVDCIGVRGDSQYGLAVAGYSAGGTGVFGIHGQSIGTAAGVRAMTNSLDAQARAVEGLVSNQSPGAGSAGVFGINNGTGGLGIGVRGEHNGAGNGVYGSAAAGQVGAAGVLGQINGTGGGGVGVHGHHNGGGYGVYGNASGAGGVGVVGNQPSGGGFAGFFFGNVHATGTLSKGGGAFKIDHPLDPANKYLQHSFVESPDMKNVYDGVVRTDARGFATVKLPRYFSALNRDFRYQLTGIGRGAWGARIVVWKEVADNRFVIRSEPSVKVSWQVTGIRKDRWANANRIQVEQAKANSERGRYLNPELYGRSTAASILKPLLAPRVPAAKASRLRPLATQRRRPSSRLGVSEAPARRLP